ncbi:MAG TPA: ImmA/IrrE family metallo-endopeptidase [Verrucomicrobiae bacterium]|jgi:hypothetical protein|nr:ImmA/IrrE family metallo-endopeptidase [Verrucomicrobiae bacterium]
MIERQRFTIFHEFAHTLFPDFCQFLPHHQSASTTEDDLDYEFENLCDIAAAEMLLPHEDFISDVQKLSWLGFEAVHNLRHRYVASIDATVYRLIDLAKTVSTSVVFLTDVKGSHPGRGPLWVKSCRPNSMFKGYVLPGTQPPASSITVRCLIQNIGTTAPVPETWWIKGRPRTYLVQAARLPTISSSPEYPKVAALLFPVSYARNWIGN